ncbi:hypothetical protein COCVIDRAFT_87512, partial [Bipolaris victoriae FI3]
EREGVQAVGCTGGKQVQAREEQRSLAEQAHSGGRRCCEDADGEDAEGAPAAPAGLASAAACGWAPNHVGR